MRYQYKFLVLTQVDIRIGIYIYIYIIYICIYTYIYSFPALETMSSWQQGAALSLQLPYSLKGTRLLREMPTPGLQPTTKVRSAQSDGTCQKDMDTRFKSTDGSPLRKVAVLESEIDTDIEHACIHKGGRGKAPPHRANLRLSPQSHSKHLLINPTGGNLGRPHPAQLMRVIIASDVQIGTMGLAQAA
jgi:hypothetical protein